MDWKTFFSKLIPSRSSPWSIRHHPETQALLNESELTQLHGQALSATTTALNIQRDVQYPLLGERTSAYAGSGYEFAENRRFIAGDDIRFINWRALARTGQLYRKVFHEERRPQLWLVVDRRAAMRFGTRSQLKVTLAVKRALYHLYQAQTQQLITGAVVLEQEARWFKASQGLAAAQALIQHLISPCPPLPFDEKEVPLEKVIQQLSVKLAPGCIIVLLSDFHDLHSNMMSILYKLTQQHSVYACHVIDPLEQALPRIGHYHFHDENRDTVFKLSCTDKEISSHYAKTMQDRHELITRVIKQAGVQYESLFTDQAVVQ